MAIFAEYIDGGTLYDWIWKRRLYEGGPQRALERMLDIAIQFAWGLQVAHKRGLVHQDVKPLNVLMTAEGVAKVADFGLAKIRHMTEKIQPQLVNDVWMEEGNRQAKNLLASWGGMTPAYCSPEQARKAPLTDKTDIWSWGVSILEMFNGGVTWNSGTVALQALESYRNSLLKDKEIPQMSESLEFVLKKCFQEDPEKRWASMDEVAMTLIEIYEREIVKKYPRTNQGSVKSAVPLEIYHKRRTKEGAQWTDPRKWVEKALQAEGRDPSEVERIIPTRTGLRKAQVIADLAGYEEAFKIYLRLVALGRKDLEEDMARLCVEKAFVHKEADDMPGALATYDKAIGIYEQLVHLEGRSDLANDLASCYMGKGNALSDLGDLKGAVAIYDKAIGIREQLVHREGRSELAGDLAWVILTKADALAKMGNTEAAIDADRKGIVMLEEEVKRTGRADLQKVLEWAKSRFQGL